MATILIKKREGSGAPVAGDLTNASGGAEIAISLADKRLYSKNSAGSIVEIGTNPSVIDILNVSGTSHIAEVAEYVNLSSATGGATVTLDWLDGGVLYLTNGVSSDFQLNIRGASGTTLNSVLATGEAAGFAVLLPQGASAVAQTDILIDGVTADPYWQNGATGTFTTSGIDLITGEIIKTGSATFTVLETVTQFKK